MKSLDEVIKALEICTSSYCSHPKYGDCPYIDDKNDCDTRQRKLDALHYLKTYRSDKAMWEADRKGYLDWIEQYKEDREKHQQAVIELKKNPALSWDELRQMVGEPVWVEQMESGIPYGKWLLVQTPPTFGDIYMVSQYRERILLYEPEMGKIWKAYRKENA